MRSRFLIQFQLTLAHPPVKLLGRVFEEQFEVVGKEIYATRKRPSRVVQNPHDPDAHYADQGQEAVGGVQGARGGECGT